MSMQSNWSFPTDVRFGAGRIRELPQALRDAGIRNPLFVTDQGLLSLPITTSTLDILRNAGMQAAVFSDVRANPVLKGVEDGVRMFREGKHDGVIAFGGGSALDTGKTIAFMAHQKGTLWDYDFLNGYWDRADPAAIAPFVTVPTTAGTGSDVGRGAMITDEATHTKKVVFHPLMRAKVVVADPELTVGMPQFITVGTGMDALAHCIESLSSAYYHPMCDAIAVEGVRLIFENLPKAYSNPDDIEARGHLMSAAAMGAVAFQKGMGAVHALSHPVGALYDTHHGMTNGVFLPYVMIANRSAIEDKIARLASYIGLPRTFDAFLDALISLRTRLAVPHTLAGLKVNGERRDEIAEMAIIDSCAPENPVELTRELALEIFDRALEGRLN
ncbi:MULTISPECIES: iron-containing alcohol dehydrogenase [unclassified Mesorhizobium]|uniref:iron-containing alcohol dehydrogenase n=1 Tax=unclassified Mesorhizobium TaxID=325217 RepID=UPI000FDC34CE|nr:MULTISPECIES: iron-containing alcohol dehydrogenase [unclassified Mesorhizobium]TGR17847.1 iron-containing alcohol dehydrogenase [Mesorhizobium sp. M8A.F.Ca.ET.197.01.1.1]TGR36613.1 iron-containing alcohol dehydrogenase [bacterium M00.F.Ca.ET.199.01.1.1]TGR39773.1 iron-containing alcohol dehydrogenase [Mesorhizobium sp. M8A.F.Ca.ET.198.01.1.1]TGV81774.1 iron-containing alcohol dehydrogenase [Mesorhizobium sp. M00.F.Ca.ET.149.01.1.1]